MKTIFCQSASPVPGDVMAGVIETFHNAGWEFVTAAFTGIGCVRPASKLSLNPAQQIPVPTYYMIFSTEYEDGIEDPPVPPSIKF